MLRQHAHATRLLFYVAAFERHDCRRERIRAMRARIVAAVAFTTALFATPHAVSDGCHGVAER